jgi:CBS-domain-containing membrane protein
MKRIGEIMIPVDEYPSVRDSTPLREAVAVIRDTQLEVGGRKSLPRALIVFDDIEVMVGTVGRRDIMKGLGPSFLVGEPPDYPRKLFAVAVDPDLSELSFDHVVTGIRQHADRPVSDVMRHVEAILNADDHVIKAIHEMVTGDLTLIPVVDGGQLVGVVRSVDVFEAMTQVLE